MLKLDFTSAQMGLGEGSGARLKLGQAKTVHWHHKTGTINPGVSFPLCAVCGLEYNISEEAAPLPPPHFSLKVSKLYLCLGPA